jgi:hypothetical protein
MIEGSPTTARSPGSAVAAAARFRSIGAKRWLRIENRYSQRAASRSYSKNRPTRIRKSSRIPGRTNSSSGASILGGSSALKTWAI